MSPKQDPETGCSYSLNIKIYIFLNILRDISKPGQVQKRMVMIYIKLLKCDIMGNKAMKLLINITMF